MKIQINKEEVFRCKGVTMAVEATTSGYMLYYSVDGEKWSKYDTEIPADENLVVNDGVSGMYFKLVGNVDDNVTVRF